MLKEKMYQARMEMLLKKGIKNGDISPFDISLYKQLENVYINGLTMSMYIKYLRPIIPPGKCFERSLYMFLSLENSILVRGDVLDLEYKYGKTNSRHGWIEIDNYVYDPSLLLKFKKDIYYEIYKPSNVIKCTKEEYLSNKEGKIQYNLIKNTKLNDYLPDGKRRFEVEATIPVISEIAKLSNNKELREDLYNYKKLIKYN